MRWEIHKAFERVKNLRPSGSGIAEKKEKGQRGSKEVQDSFNYWVTETITTPNACESPQNKLRRLSKKKQLLAGKASVRK